ncbi:MAG: EamA family transporter, partial [Gemmatimonadaceae bacterium]|nr:EamA family transporter [Acetobacteraceae bacterium]
LGFWACALAGSALVVTFAVIRSGSTGLTIQPADGLLLAAMGCAAIGYGYGARLSQHMRAEHVICWALVLALPATVAITVVQWDGAALARATPGAWAGFAYVSVVASFAGFFAWYRGLALGGVARVGQVQLAQPVLALGWAWLLLNEAITWPMAVTALAVLACVVATQKTR